MTRHELAGRSLGTRTVSYDDRDVILYALAVGATADELDLIFERRLRVLPTYALTLGLWAPDALGRMGAFEVSRAVHGSQSLTMRAPLPVSGGFDVHAHVDEVWDKGNAAIFDVAVGSEYFDATYSIFAPGAGGFGGPRRRTSPDHVDHGQELLKSDSGGALAHDQRERVTTSVATFAEQAALYRLTGDRHLIHVLPEAAQRIGQPRPIMHGLCTLASSVLALARAVVAHPADLHTLTGRFSAPVLPGQVLDVRAGPANAGVNDVAAFDVEVEVAGQPVITAARMSFAAGTSNPDSRPAENDEEVAR